MNYKNAISSISEQIKDVYEDREANNIANILLEDLFGTDWIINQELLSKEQLVRLENAIFELKMNKPLQYITGIADFYGLKFLVNEHVLIPRPETEEIVYQILQDHTNENKIDVLDIGTGSGCIPITISKNRPIWKISALDVSKDALNIASKNAQLNQVNINLILNNVLDQNLWSKFAIYDIIVSNPPYIDIMEKHKMKANVLDYEPHLALFVDGDDDLLFYKKIILFSFTNLKVGGSLYFECNEYNSSLLKEYLLTIKYLDQIKIMQDIQGKNRMIMAKRI